MFASVRVWQRLAGLLAQHASADRAEQTAASLTHARIVVEEVEAAVWHLGALPSRQDLRDLRRRVREVRRRIDRLDQEMGRLEQRLDGRCAGD